MKTTLCSIVVAVAVAFTCASEPFAQDRNYPGLIAGSEIKGTKVKNLQNEEIGDIHELLIEPVASRIRLLILSVGGFLGIGDTKVAVPWTAFQIAEENGKPKYLLDATKERLKEAPKVEVKNYDRLYARETAEPLFLYWHETWITEP
jgi:hypothetical protein